MKTYELKITIDDNGVKKESKVTLFANSLAEIGEQLKAYSLLNRKMLHENIMAAVEIITQRPKLIPTITEIIKDTEGKNDLQITLSAPVYVSKVMKVLKAE